MSDKLQFTCLKFIAALAFMLLLQTAKAQFSPELDALIEQRKKEFGGKMVVMAWKDTVVYQKGTGDLTINSQGPIGCSSAWLTAALAMTFVDQGKISLDDPVSDYLPIYAKYAKSYLTIRHCLANTTGLQPDKGGVQKLFQKNKFSSLEDEVNSFASSREIINNPGEAFYYNNIGTNIVGRVLEIAGKKSFDRLMSERIFRPLKMKKSSFASETAINPFSGAVSSPADYMQFLAMLLNKGTLNGKKILSEESVGEMLKMQTGEAKILFVPHAVNGSLYGLGNWIDPQENNSVFSCPGISGGWPYIDTSKKYACVIFVPSKEKEDKKEAYLDIIRGVKELPALQ